MRLGTWLDDESPAELDFDALLAGRLAIIGQSGAGKSWCLRKILEITAGHAQQIVLDREDDLYTIREVGDYVLAGGPDGDVPVAVPAARGLGKALVELGTSAIVQLNSIGDDDVRRLFVGEFLTGLLAVGREHWHPMLVVVDEAQVFVPAGVGGPASKAVKALMSQGRKRQWAGILTSQRLPKIHPDARGDVQTWLIGRVGQALDRRTACDLLGFSATTAEAMRLQTADPGVFWAFGPALSAMTPRLLKVGSVTSTHIPPGGASVPTPPPPERVLAVLASLAAAEPMPAAEEPETGPVLAGQLTRIQRELERSREAQRALEHRLATAEQRAGQATAVLEKICALITEVGAVPTVTVIEQPSVDTTKEVSVPQRKHRVESAVPRQVDSRPNGEASMRGLRGAGPRLLKALGEVYPAAVTWGQACSLAGLKARGGHFNAGRKWLLSSGYVKTEGDQITLTEAGLTEAGQEPLAPMSRDEWLKLWCERLPAPAPEMLRELNTSGPIDVASLAARLGKQPRGGHWHNGMALLRRNELVEEVHGGRLRLAGVLANEPI